MKRTNRVPFVIAGLVSAFSTGLLFTWSYFRAPLAELFPTWTAADLSMIFSLHNTVVCIAMILCGFFAKKVSPRIRLTAAAILIGGGLGCYPFLPINDPQLSFKLAFLFFSVIAAIGVGIASPTWTGTFVLWAPERPGLMVGCLLLVYGCCPFAYGALASVLIPKIGVLQMFRVIGGISAVLMLCCLPFMRLPRPSDGLPPAKVSAANKNDKSFTTWEMIKTPAFWAIFLFNVSMRSAGLIFADHSADIALSFGVAALFGMIYSPANGSASLVAGLLIDKIGSAKTMRVFGSILIAGSLLLYIAGLSAIATVSLVGLLAAGFAFGGTSASNSSTVRLFFGADYYTQNYSITTFSIFFASIFCYIAGFVVEKMDGSYYGIYTMTLVFGAIALACTFWLKACERKSALKEASAEPKELTQD